MRKKILLYADAYQGFVGQSTDYTAFFSKFGEVILITPQNNLDWALDNGDVLAVPGGADVDPWRYGERPRQETGRCNPHYEYLDECLLTPWIFKTNKPVVGICRGIQTINVVLGGTLHQHVYDHEGVRKGKENRLVWQNLHTVYNHFPKGEQYGVQPLKLKVNSYHHQAIKKLGEGLKVLGWTCSSPNCPSATEEEGSFHSHIILSEKDGFLYRTKKEYWALPELLIHETKPIIGFQYHPENVNCKFSSILIDAMLNDIKVGDVEQVDWILKHQKLGKKSELGKEISTEN